jgi:hypothetical protein
MRYLRLGWRRRRGGSNGDLAFRVAALLGYGFRGSLQFHENGREFRCGCSIARQHVEEH